MLSPKTLTVLLPLFLALSPSTIALPQAASDLSPSSTTSGERGRVVSPNAAVSAAMAPYFNGDEEPGTSIDMPTETGLPAHDRYNQTSEDSSDAGWPSDNSTDYDMDFNSTSPYTTDRHSSYSDNSDLDDGDDFSYPPPGNPLTDFPAYINTTKPAVADALRTLQKALNLSLVDKVEVDLTFNFPHFFEGDLQNSTVLMSVRGQDPMTVVGSLPSNASAEFPGIPHGPYQDFDF